MSEYIINLDEAADLDIYATFPEVIYHFDIEDRPIQIVKTYEWDGYSIGETIIHDGTEHVIEYFGILDCELSSMWRNAPKGVTVVVVNRSGFAVISEIRKLDE